MTRIVVTGLGAVSPVGTGRDTFWDSLVAGKSGLGPITHFDASETRNDLGGEVRDWVPPEEWEGYGRSVQYALGAAREAIDDAGVPRGERTGCCLATNFGGAEDGEAVFWALLEGEALPRSSFDQYSFNCGTDLTSRHFGLDGPQASISLSCASGVAALGYSVDQIRLGRADAMVAGGYDELSLFSYAGLCALRAVAPDTILPFDKRRKGTIFSEGAGVVVIESLESAEKRGAHVYAEVLGHAMNNDAFHMTAPDRKGSGIKAVMRAALEDARISPADVDHINAHGTGTPYNDKIETAAIKEVFGVHAKEMPVVSIKSEMGHTMAAAGSLEVICSALTIHRGVIPPTIGIEVPDPDCDLDYVPGECREQKVKTVQSNSYGLGGTNASIVLREFIL